MAPATTKTATSKAKAGTDAGVKKAGRPKGTSKNASARAAMAKMQAYFKEHRPKYKHLDFKEQQKELGKQWKTAPENPKNKT